MGARIGIEANLEFIGREHCWELSRRPYFTIGVHFVRFIVLGVDIRTGVFLRRVDVNHGSDILLFDSFRDQNRIFLDEKRFQTSLTVRSIAICTQYCPD